MRRISDGVKTVVRYKTTDAMERAFVETVGHTYLYQDGENHVFMNPTSFEQINITSDMLGDSAAFLQEGMECQVALFNDGPISIELPARVTLEIAETEPAIKNQTHRHRSSQQFFRTAFAHWCHRTSLLVRASWWKPLTALMLSARKTNYFVKMPTISRWAVHLN
jgi:hypothetical protein